MNADGTSTQKSSMNAAYLPTENVFPFSGLTIGGTNSRIQFYNGTSPQQINTTSDPTPAMTRNYDYVGVGGTQTTIAKFTLNDIRELAIAQTEMEKMARTDGTYMGFAMTFFGEKPKNANDYKVTYIGGSYTDITFTEVIQTSQSTEQSPLGTYGGHGIGGIGQEDGYLGHVHCDDFGYIMILACIMPDVYYSQGINKDLLYTMQSDYYLPERAKMGMIPILNHEIYALDTYEKGQELFAWNNPYDELRYRANEIHGKIADPNNKSFAPYTQARFFNATPTWGKEFAEAADVRKDFLQAPSEIAYTAEFAINIRAVRELPYKAIPASII